MLPKIKTILFNLKESIMKKVLFAVVAMIAIGFTSCTNKAQAPAEAEGVNIEEVVSDATSQLQAAIDGADAGKLQTVIDAIKAKAAELDPEIAKEYITKVQDFLKENADKIKAFAGENETLNAAITALTAAPADAIVSGLKSAVGAAGDAVEGAVEDAQDAAAEKAEEIKDAAKEEAG